MSSDYNTFSNEPDTADVNLIYDDSADADELGDIEFKTRQRKPRVMLLFVVGALVVCAVVAIAIRLSGHNSSSNDNSGGGRNPIVVEKLLYNYSVAGDINFAYAGKSDLLSGTLGIGTVKGEAPQVFSQESGLVYKWPDTILTVTSTSASCLQFSWQSFKGSVLTDCYDLNTQGGTKWFGGGETYVQNWPLNANQDMKPFRAGDMYADHSAFGSSINPLWFSSRGASVFASAQTLLHVSFNATSGDPDTLGDRLCLQSNGTGFNAGNPGTLDYVVCGDTSLFNIMTKNLHVLLTPSKPVDTRMIEQPIFSTWARYKTHINQSIVEDFAQEILDHDFPVCQIEIDDKYSTHYGDFTFDPDRFPDAQGMVDKLHALGMRATLWVYPFANPNSTAFAYGTEHHYFVYDDTNKAGMVKWWNGEGAVVDFTNKAASTWFQNRLHQVRLDYHIDSFKFDAGESYYLPKHFKTSAPIANPGLYTTAYVALAAGFGTMVEVRSSYFSESFSVFVREMDRSSSWGLDNGLHSVITAAFAIGVNGYPFVMPDMIGGNAYNGKPDKELYIRWCQLAAFFPAMQFSIVPWDFDAQTTTLCKAAVDLHTNISSHIVEAAANATKTAVPVIRPIWASQQGIFEDDVTVSINDQFMVGDHLMVAPMLQPGASQRKVYIPRGRWLDATSNTYFVGPKFITANAPLDTIPYYFYQ